MIAKYFASFFIYAIDSLSEKNHKLLLADQ